MARSEKASTSSPSGAGGKQNLSEESLLLLTLYKEVIEASHAASGLRSALEIVCRFTGWVCASVWLPCDEGARIGLYSSWHQDDPKLAEFIELCRQRRFLPDVGLAGRVWHGGKEEWSRDLAAESAALFPLALAAAKAGIKAAFAVPIADNSHRAGVLMLHGREAREHDPALVQLTGRLATQLGFALRHKGLEQKLSNEREHAHRSHETLEGQVARQTEELSSAREKLQAEVAIREQIEDRIRQRVCQQQAIADLGLEALGGADLSTIMCRVTDLVAKTLNVEFCKILEVLPGSDELLLRAGVGWREGLVGQATVSGGTNSQAGYTLLCREPVVIENLATEERFCGPPLLRDHGIVSGMSVIIGPRDRPFGVLGAHAAKSRDFSRDDVNFLQATANVLFQVIEHDRALREIRRSATWLERLIATTQDAVVAIDRRGCVVLFNAAAERVFGYRAEEVIGGKVNRLMAEPYATEHDDYMARYERTGEARAIGCIRTVEGRRKNGEIFPLELSITEIAVDENVQYAAFIRDISEKSRLQSQLVESERLAAIGSTAAKIGHELANPLNGMSLTVQLLEQRLGRMASGADTNLTPTVKRLKDEISRLQKLAGEFATISRKEKYAFQEIKLAQLIEEVVELYKPNLGRAGIEIRIDLDLNLPVMRLDADKMKQALLNLLKNAAEALPHGGNIAIHTFSSGDIVAVEITDNGPGIPPEIDVFEPFVTTKKEGTGLGLNIVRQILAAHHGKISYTSSAGGGTTFRLELPAKV